MWWENATLVQRVCNVSGLKVAFCCLLGLLTLMCGALANPFHKGGRELSSRLSSFRFGRWRMMPGNRVKRFCCRFSSLRFWQNAKVTGKSCSLFFLTERTSSCRSLPTEGGNSVRPTPSRQRLFRLWRLQNWKAEFNTSVRVREN